MPIVSGGGPGAFSSESELSALLVLLYDASASVRSVQATWRVWSAADRVPRTINGEGRRPAATPVDDGRRRDLSQGNEETVRIWQQSERIREEHSGGRRDGSYAVVDGPLWWLYDPRIGIRSNADDPSITSTLGRELAVMFEPAPLLGVLRFCVLGRSDVAGRPTILVRAWPRRPRDDDACLADELGQLGAGADEYELEVDLERGALLAAIARADGKPFRSITALDVRFDNGPPPGTFRFDPPRGEAGQPATDLQRSDS